MDNLKAGFALFVTLLVLAAGAVFVAYLVGKVAANQSEWDRYVYLLTGVEAVVFAAVGWLFGKEVHREQAEKASKQADAANARATTAQTEAATARASLAGAEERGKGLALGILAAEKSAQNRVASLRAVGFADVEAARANNAVGVAQLAEQARLAYPNL